MAKWYGEIGYSKTIETRAGYWEEKIYARNYYGDAMNNYYRRQSSGESVNRNIKYDVTLSILADQRLIENCSNIIYAEYMGTKWQVDKIDASQYPRLLLTIGEVYTEDEQT